MELTELQTTCWSNIGQQSAATQKIRKNAFSFYVQYREHLKNTNSFQQGESKIQNLFLICYFISEKCQIVYDMNGKRIENIAFSINKLAKSQSCYKQFFYHLKQIMKVINLPEQSNGLQQQMLSFTKYFSFLITFHTKFLSTYTKVTVRHNINSKDLQSIGGQTQYIQKIKYMVWLVFINFRRQGLGRQLDTIGNTCAIAMIIVYYVTQMYRTHKVMAIYAPKIVQDLGTFPYQFQQIEQIVLEHFSLKDIRTYHSIRNTFFKFIQSLCESHNEMKNPFQPKKIISNIKHLQQLYYSQINCIDQTLLMSNQQNIKFTALGGKRGFMKSNPNPIFSKRILTYQSQTKMSLQQTLPKQLKPTQSQPNYVSLMSKIKCSNTPVPLIQATPINQFTSGYNWLYQKSINVDRLNALDLESLLEVGYNSDEFQLDNQQILAKRHLIQGLFNHIIRLYPRDSQQQINVCTVLSLEVFYQVMNITNRDFIQLVQFLNLSWFAVWQGLHKILNFDPKMPNSIKTHLLLVQTTIISSLIWKQESIITILQGLNSCQQQYSTFYRRVLHHLAYEINFIGRQLLIEEDKQLDQMFILCQYFLTEFCRLVRNMNLDVIVMCSVYGVCKAKSLKIKFKQVMNVYKKVNNITDKQFEILQNFNSCQGQQMNIIEYYNKVYLKHCTPLLIKIRQQNISFFQPLQSSFYLHTPVKSLIFSTPIKSHLSPTLLLQAYNESPLLKQPKRFQSYSQLNKQNNDGLLNRKKLYDEEGLREKFNVGQMIIKKFGNSKGNVQKASNHIHKHHN